jgi:serine/threonine protein kinase
VSPRPSDRRTADTRRLVGRYRLDSELGRGAMGTVWSAYDEVLHRPVAVKEVRLSLVPVSERAIVRERTLREARATAMLSHPNVVTLYDVVEVDSEPYVVMELLPSRSLASYIGERGTLSHAETAEIGSAVASALMTAHRAGITHRDVKPGNVLIGTDGQIKLTDFGIARNAAESSMTQTGTVLGSPPYIAPEVAMGRAVGPPADLWGLGATLFACLEGRPPYDAGDPVSTVSAVVHGEVPRPAGQGPVVDVVRGLMVKDPGMRMPLPAVRRRLRPLMADPEGPMLSAPSPATTELRLPTKPADDEPRSGLIPVRGRSGTLVDQPEAGAAPPPSPPRRPSPRPPSARTTPLAGTPPTPPAESAEAPVEEKAPPEQGASAPVEAVEPAPAEVPAAEDRQAPDDEAPGEQAPDEAPDDEAPQATAATEAPADAEPDAAADDASGDGATVEGEHDASPGTGSSGPGSPASASPEDAPAPDDEGTDDAAGEPVDEVEPAESSTTTADEPASENGHGLAVAGAAAGVVAASAVAAASGSPTTAGESSADEDDAEPDGPAEAASDQDGSTGAASGESAEKDDVEVPAGNDAPSPGTPSSGTPRTPTPSSGTPRTPTPSSGTPRTPTPSSGVPRTPTPPSGSSVPDPSASETTLVTPRLPDTSRPGPRTGAPAAWQQPYQRPQAPLSSPQRVGSAQALAADPGPLPFAPSRPAAPTPSRARRIGIVVLVVVLALAGLVGGYAAVRVIGGQPPLSVSLTPEGPVVDGERMVAHSDDNARYSGTGMGFTALVPSTWQQFRLQEPAGDIVVRYVSDDADRELRIDRLSRFFPAEHVSDYVSLLGQPARLGADAVRVEPLSVVAPPRPGAPEPVQQTVYRARSGATDDRTTWTRLIPSGQDLWVVRMTAPSTSPGGALDQFSVIAGSFTPPV